MTKDSFKPKQTILIFGISSFVGSNIADILSEHFRVIGTYYNSPIKAENILTIKCDVLNKDEVQSIFATFRPDYVIYAVGLTSLIDCAEKNDLADALNMGGLFTVSDFCQRYKSQVIYLSSAYVFAGEDKIYQEKDIPDPNTVFGKTKASAEFFLQKNSLNYLIFRFCPLYGRGANYLQRNIFENLQIKILKGETFVVDSNVITGFLDVSIVAMLIKLAIEKNVQNRLIQASSSDFMHSYDFAKTYCEIFDTEGKMSRGKWSFPHVQGPGSRYEGGNFNYKMSVTNIKGILNVEMPTIKESLLFTKKRFFGSNQKEKGSGGGGDINFI
jgi:dTDP-4-dehydrorhamnose reductase